MAAVGGGSSSVPVGFVERLVDELCEFVTRLLEELP
jgi:hypothetical protein